DEAEHRDPQPQQEAAAQVAAGDGRGQALEPLADLGGGGLHINRCHFFLPRSTPLILPAFLLAWNTRSPFFGPYSLVMAFLIVSPFFVSGTARLLRLERANGRRRGPAGRTDFFPLPRAG